MHERLYRSLYRIRRVEEELARAHPGAGASPGAGAVAVGVCAALRPQDVVFGTGRGAALYLARGGDLRQLIAELSRGDVADSATVTAPECGVMGAAADAAAALAGAVGYACALASRGQGAVVAAFLGDGAPEEAAFREGLTWAARQRLPVLFVAESDPCAAHTPHSQRQGVPALAERARGFGLAAERLDGTDLPGLVRRALAVVPQVRAGAGPCLLDVTTYRRGEGRGAAWGAGDPVRGLAEAIDPQVRAYLEEHVEEEIAAALAFAADQPAPPARDGRTSPQRQQGTSAGRPMSS
jgi:TPP-dependent pyruvate/acetoin dehydrogenase alpha subunit